MANDSRLLQFANQDDFVGFSRRYAEIHGQDAADREAGGMFNGFKKMNSNTGSAGGTSYGNSRGQSGIFNNNRSQTNMDAPDSFGGWVKAALSTQYKQYDTMEDREFQDLGSVMDLLVDEAGRVRGPLGIVKNAMTDIGMALMLQFKQQNQLLMDMGEKTGIIGTLGKEFREEITDAYPESLRLGISFSELSDSITDLVTESGKFKLISSDTIEEMALASKFASDMKEYAALAGNFERVSMGIYDMTQATNQAGKDSMAIGLNARQTVADIAKNLDMLNTYGFRRGVAGLTDMVQKSIEFRMNMDATTKLADKVWSPEGALDVVANLQVLGGAVGDLNDPLKLMYMATNNIEGLQDAIIGASKSLVTYNEEQKRFEVTGANLRRAKEMADEFGMSMTELTTTAVAAMERTRAETDLLSQGLVMDDEDREFLTNLAQMKEGRMVIEVPKSLAEEVGGQTELALSEMSQEYARVLLGRKDELEDKTMHEIARDQVSMIENINRDVSFITSLMRVEAGKAGDQLLEEMGWDPKKLGMEAYNLANQFGGKIEGSGELVINNLMNETKGGEWMKDKAGGAGVEKPVRESGESPTKKVEGTMNVNFNAPSGVMDSLTRQIANNPSIVAPMSNSFLNMLGDINRQK